jgi:hypothetical protein
MDVSERYLFYEKRTTPGSPAHRTRPTIGATMLVALLVLVMFVALPLLSLRYGVDSRHFSTRERRSNW